MMVQMEKQFRRDIDSLEEIFAFLREFKRRSGLDDSLAFRLDLIVEELFTNVVKYHSGNPNDVLIHLETNPCQLILALTDFDVEPFDITARKDVDTSICLEERPIGGLGIHLVKCMADEVTYEYCGRDSKITVIQHLER